MQLDWFASSVWSGSSSSVLFVASWLLCLCLPVQGLWPKPREFSQGSKPLWLARDVRLSITSSTLLPNDLLDRWKDGQQQHVLKHPSSSSAYGRNYSTIQVAGKGLEDILQSRFDQIRTSVFTEHFVPEKFYPNGAIPEPGIIQDSKVLIEKVVIEMHELAEDAKQVDAMSSEAYTLHVPESGQVLIEALSLHGGLHALETFRQLFFGHSEDKSLVYMPNAPIVIRDGPVFEHRGLNLDISRNRIYPRDVLRTLNAMAANKLNRLHIHATDSQSWPLEIPDIPEITRKGAYHKSQIWSAADLRNVQRYGGELGVEVFIEVDLPGHTGSLSHSFPDLIVAYKEDWTVYALEPPAGQLKLADPDVAPFLDKLFSDLLPRITPFTSYFHLGGDELNTKSYLLEPGLETSDRTLLRPYVQAFFDHVFGLLSKHNLTPILWEESITEWDLDLPPATIIQSWRAHESLAKITSKGHRALFGASSHWYLDCGFGTWADPDPNKPPDSKLKPPFSDWCPPYKNWRLVYSYDPLDSVPEEHRQLVIGGEVHLWGELTDSVTLDGMLWPRVAAAAEIMWSGKSALSEDTTRRLAEMRERLVGGFGIAAGMVQMEWCLKNPGGYCSM